MRVAGERREVDKAKVRKGGTGEQRGEYEFILSFSFSSLFSSLSEIEDIFSTVYVKD